MTLIASRWENILPLAGCVAFMGVGLWLIVMGSSAGWLALILFGAGAVVLGWQAVHPEKWRLELREDGFTATSLGLTTDVAWEDVVELGIMVQAGRSRVAWRTRGVSEGPGFGRRASRAVSGWDGALSSNYGRSPKQLKALLEERWRRALDSSRA